MVTMQMGEGRGDNIIDWNYTQTRSFKCHRLLVSGGFGLFEPARVPRILRDVSRQHLKDPIWDGSGGGVMLGGLGLLKGTIWHNAKSFKYQDQRGL